MTDVKPCDETPEKPANGRRAAAREAATVRAGSRPPPAKEPKADGDGIAELGDEIGGPA